MGIEKNMEAEMQILKDELTQKLDSMMQYELQLFNIMNQNIKSAVKEVISSVLTGALMLLQKTCPTS